MKIDRFELEFWLNPLDSKARYNFGSSCCKPVTVAEMLELTGTDREDFLREIEAMSLHYGYFEGMPRLRRAIAGLYDGAVTPEMVLSVHGGDMSTPLLWQCGCCGEQFKASPTLILHGGHWCPACLRKRLSSACRADRS